MLLLHMVSYLCSRALKRAWLFLPPWRECWLLLRWDTYCSAWPAKAWFWSFVRISIGWYYVWIVLVLTWMPEVFSGPHFFFFFCHAWPELWYLPALVNSGMSTLLIALQVLVSCVVKWMRAWVWWYLVKYLAKTQREPPADFCNSYVSPLYISALGKFEPSLQPAFHFLFPLSHQEFFGHCPCCKL